MLRQKTTSPNRQQSESLDSRSPQVENLKIQKELDRLEEVVLDSQTLFGQTLVREDQLLRQLDLIRLSLPEAFRRAEDLLQRRQEILDEAEHLAQEIVHRAQQQAAQILDERRIVQQAEYQAQQIRQQVQQEARTLKDQTLGELEQLRGQVYQELEQTRRQKLAECQALQTGADNYADGVLAHLEQQLLNRLERDLGEMLRVVRNGRQQLRQGANRSLGPQTAGRIPMVPSSDRPQTPGKRS